MVKPAFTQPAEVIVTGEKQKAADDALSDAVELFRENEAMFGDIKQDKEKANLYRGLAAMAETLQMLVGECRKS